MGCKQSSIINYAEITEEDKKNIPLLFRDLSARKKTKGMKYWFNTCSIREGTLPLKIGENMYSIEYACVTKHGFYPEEVDRRSQDSFSLLKSKYTIESKEVNGIYIGVYDGHGVYGAECSNFCKDYMEEKVTTGLTVNSSTAIGSFISENLVSCSSKMHEMKYQGGLDDTNSGTTAVCVSLINDEITCVNVGDSRCIAGYVTANDQILPVPLSQDQNPIREDEKLRVEACGADVFTIAQKMHSNHSLLHPDGSYSLADPPRIYLKNCTYPGAAFSRSIGDCIAETIGVIAEGEINTKKCCSGVNHIIIGSDGLWNFINEEEVVTCIKYSKDLTRTAISFVLTAYLRWLDICNSSDDITMIVLRFPPLPTSLDEKNGIWVNDINII